MLPKVSVVALLWLTTAFSAVYGNTLEVRGGDYSYGVMRRDDGNKTSPSGPPNGSPAPGPPSDSASPGPSKKGKKSKNEKNSKDDPPSGSPSPSPSNGDNSDEPVDPPGNPCVPPPGGWSTHYQPDPKCGPKPLLDWCKAVYNPDTIFACWDDYNYFCAACIKDGQKSKSKPGPAKTVHPAKLPSCATAQDRKNFCAVCTTYSGCLPPSGSPPGNQ